MHFLFRAALAVWCVLLIWMLGPLDMSSVASYAPYMVLFITAFLAFGAGHESGEK